MATFLSKMNLIVNNAITWVSQLSSWMVTDILMAFALACTIFGITIRIFRKVKKIL